MQADREKLLQAARREGVVESAWAVAAGGAGAGGRATDRFWRYFGGRDAKARGRIGHGDEGLAAQVALTHRWTVTPCPEV